MTNNVEIRHFHLFCGLGGGAAGFNRGEARVGNARARFRCLGGIDVDPAACRDFERRADAPATQLDLMDRNQYIAFHGQEPPADWREATPDDIRKAAGNEHPHIIFTSAPCKGFSGLLPEKTASGNKYQALNSMAARGVALMLEAWADDPVELIIFENVPRIATRGRDLLDVMVKLMKAHGYAVRETVHDCGEIGGLGQSRKRFLMVARHKEKVPPFLYQPQRKPLKGVGDVIGRFPVPGPDLRLPMHRLPSLHWKTWVRLAFVEAGKDWRSLRDLNVKDGFLTDYGIVPEAGYAQPGVLGVRQWGEASGTVTGRGGPTNGTFSVADPRNEAFKGGHGVRDWRKHAATVAGESLPSNGAYSIADPRIDGHERSVQHGVRQWNQPAGVVTGKMLVGGGPHSVADPRLGEGRFNNIYRIVRFGDTSPSVTGGTGPSAGGIAVADPRARGGFSGKGKYRVAPMDGQSGTVIGASTTGQGAFALADPRMNWSENAHHNIMAVRRFDTPAKTITGAGHVTGGASVVADPRPGIDGSTYTTQPYYGVVPWMNSAKAVTAAACHDNGAWSVADPRGFPGAGDDVDSEADILPGPNDKLVCRIRALDGTWHRPFTTLELAALQGLVAPDRIIELDGASDSAWRERIGNAVPEPAAAAIAGVMGQTLLLAWSGTSFMLSSEDIWVRPNGLVTALSVQDIEEGYRI